MLCRIALHSLADGIIARPTDRSIIRLTRVSNLLKGLVQKTLRESLTLCIFHVVQKSIQLFPQSWDIRRMVLSLMTTKIVPTRPLSRTAKWRSLPSREARLTLSTSRPQVSLQSMVQMRAWTDTSNSECSLWTPSSRTVLYLARVGHNSYQSFSKLRVRTSRRTS